MKTIASSRYRLYLARLYSCLGGALGPLLLGYSTRLLLLLFLFTWRVEELERCRLELSPSKVKIFGLLCTGAPTRAPGGPSTRPSSWRRFFRAWYFCLMRMTVYSVEEKLALGAWLVACCLSVSPSLWISSSISPSVRDAEVLLSWSFISICGDRKGERFLRIGASAD